MFKSWVTFTSVWSEYNFWFLRFIGSSVKLYTLWCFHNMYSIIYYISITESSFILSFLFSPILWKFLVLFSSSCVFVIFILFQTNSILQFQLSSYIDINYILFVHIDYCRSWILLSLNQSNYHILGKPINPI